MSIELRSQSLLSPPSLNEEQKASICSSASSENSGEGEEGVLNQYSCLPGEKQQGSVEEQGHRNSH